jgi:AcrR family transcriptional regulator
MSTRSYDSALRAEQARLTRSRILEAAHRLLLDRGHRVMTLAALADEASVSTQTIYNAVGNKAAVIKAVYDVALAGDDDPRPIGDRPEFRAVTGADDPTTLLRAYARLGRQIAARVGPLLAVLLSSPDDDVRAFAATIDGERLRGNAMAVGQLARRFGLPDGVTRQRAVDIVWALTAPETFDRLVRQRRWSLDAYERWLGDSMIAALVDRRPDVD